MLCCPVHAEFIQFPRSFRLILFSAILHYSDDLCGGCQYLLPCELHMQVLYVPSANRCDQRHMPLVTDVEFDRFIQIHAPTKQLLIVNVTSTRYAPVHIASPVAR